MKRITIEYNPEAERKTIRNELGLEQTVDRDVEDQIRRFCQMLFNGSYTITVQNSDENTHKG